MRKNLSFAAPIILFFSCGSDEIGNSKDVNPETIYISYDVMYEEGMDAAECLAQYRFAGEDGTTLVLNNPSEIMFDDKSLQVDSNTNYPGAYYLTKISPAGFSGKHEWKYTDVTGKIYLQTFEFIPFHLSEEIPQQISSDRNLEIKISGLKDGDNITCSIADTAFSTNDIEQDFVIKDNSIDIPSSLLQNLSAGPLEIKISSRYKSPLQQPTREGGLINYYYGIETRKTNFVKTATAQL